MTQKKIIRATLCVECLEQGKQLAIGIPVGKARARQLLQIHDTYQQKKKERECT